MVLNSQSFYSYNRIWSLITLSYAKQHKNNYYPHTSEGRVLNNFPSQMAETFRFQPPAMGKVESGFIGKTGKRFIGSGSLEKTMSWVKMVKFFWSLDSFGIICVWSHTHFVSDLWRNLYQARGCVQRCQVALSGVYLGFSNVFSAFHAFYSILVYNVTPSRTGQEGSVTFIAQIMQAQSARCFA
jgi:hypothetical protein